MAPTLGQRLRALRAERGLSQADLAGDLVSPSYVSLIESGRRSPERDVLEGLARKLRCSVFYLESGMMPEELNEQRLRLQFAEIALANGALDEAREKFGEVAEHARGEIRHSATWGLVRAEEAAGDLHAAVTHLEELLAAARASEPGAPALMLLLNTHCRLYHEAGDFSRSIDVGENALREVRDLGLDGTEEEITLATTLVSSYWLRGDIFSAQHLASQVIERAERLGTRTARGRIYWNACLVAEARGELTLALDLAQRSLALMAASSLDLNLAALRITYGWLLLRCDPPRLDEAQAAMRRRQGARWPRRCSSLTTRSRPLARYGMRPTSPALARRPSAAAWPRQCRACGTDRRGAPPRAPETRPMSTLGIPVQAAQQESDRLGAEV